MSRYFDALNRLAERSLHSAQPIDELQTQYAPLRERLLVAANGKPLRTLLFAGCEGEEGATSVIAEFAETLAGSGPDVLLVDADLRTSGLTKRTEARGPDLWRLVTKGGAPTPTSRGKGRLSVIPSPASTPDRELFFRSPEFARWLDAQRDGHDYVLFDTAPLLRFADATLIGRLTDGVVIVVRADTTRRDVPIALQPYLSAYLD
jgi:Mrp family chromosome partitioning ATPase